MKPAFWPRVTKVRGRILDLRKRGTEGISPITLRGFHSHGQSGLDIM